MVMAAILSSLEDEDVSTRVKQASLVPALDVFPAASLWRRRGRAWA